jgi:hypothetical protein
MIDAFCAFDDAPRWLAWREEPRGNTGKPTKVPYDPKRPGCKADATDPATWARRIEAVGCAKELANGTGRTGVGIALGDIGDNTYLAGVDLDSSLDENSALAPWAVPIISTLVTYSEISPSGCGIKCFFYIDADVVRPFLNLISVDANKWGCKRGISGLSGADHGPGIEIYTRDRYFTTTGRLWSMDHQRIVLAEWCQLEALAKLIPPSARASSGGNDTRDNSRSALAFRAALALRGASYEAMCDRLRDHPEIAIREWVAEKGEDNGGRELRRIWNHPLVQAAAARASAQTPPGVRPVVQVSGGELPNVVDRAEDILIARDPDVYEFGDQVMRTALAPIRIADSRTAIGLRLVPVKLHHMVERFTRHIDFRRFNKKENKWLSIDCPEAVAKTFLERVGLWRLPKMTAITCCPLLLADGRILDQPGFDTESGILFDPQGMTFPPVLARPTKDQAAEALGVLKALFSEFPFTDSISGSVMWSALLSSVSRPAFDCVPLHGFDAPTAGTGKSKLVDCCVVLVRGHECAVISQGDDEAEFEKRLGAVLLEGDRLISVDNCDGPLGGQLLCQTVAQRFLKIRVLGFSKTATVANAAMMFATGNNLKLSGDMLRRGLVCHLDAGVERPELRTFQHEDPVLVLKRDRGRYVAAALTVLHAYNVAGRPIKRQPLGGFEGWSDLVRNALIWLDEADPVDALEAARTDDPERQYLEAVVTQWRDVLGDRSVTTRTVIEEACGFTSDPTPTKPNHIAYWHPDFRNALLDVASDRGRISSVRLGRWIGRNRHKVVGQHRLVPATVRDGNARWKLEERQPDGRWQ